MRQIDGRLTCSATDAANFIACRHKTSLDAAVARGVLEAPTWQDPLAEQLRRRGEAHEAAYVAELRAAGRTVTDLSSFMRSDRSRALAAARAAMQAGHDVIVQAALGNDEWFGYADVLARVEEPSGLGAWSYEAQDTKLSRETRGGTILQLCVYSELLAGIQGRTPDEFLVVTPAATERYRVDSFAAYFRVVKRRLFEAIRDADPALVDEVASPVEHCDICRWWTRCHVARRRTDHLSFVADLGRAQEDELKRQGIATLAALAAMPLPVAFAPKRGSRETYADLREQARLQLERRETGRVPFDPLPIVEKFGLSALPAPSPGDVFLDLEGARFVRDGGHEYLFGLGRRIDGEWRYTAYWALTEDEEARAFRSAMVDIRGAVAADPGAHVYHFGSYEPTAFKKLMGRHAMLGLELDDLLRGERFVDLHAVVRHAIRAGVESYSIKALEPLYGFERQVVLAQAADQRRLIDDALEAGEGPSIAADIRRTVTGYNEDDCRSTLHLRDWLEVRRDEAVAAGAVLVRPTPSSSDASEAVKARQARIDSLRHALLARRETAPANEAEALRVLAYLIDWHYREDKVTWWEYFRLRDLPDEDLIDERSAVTGLAFIENLGPVLHATSRKPTKSAMLRFGYPPQECEIKAGKKLETRDGPWGDVVEADRLRRTLDIKTTKVEARPTSAFAFEKVQVDKLSEAVCALGDAVAADGFDAARRPAVDLLLRRPPTVAGVPLSDMPRMSGEAEDAFAVRIAPALDDTLLAIQGPPGSGKTRTGARMILALVRAGRRVGVTANSHQVILNLLGAVREAAQAEGLTLRCGHKGDGDEASDGIIRCLENDEAHERLTAGHFDVMGGTAYMWARPEFASTVDTLFVDEAGQMALANVIAVAGAATRIVLLGDPRQLEQPQKGSHPDGVGISALEHLLDSHATMPATHGLFLPRTWRLAPPLCAATSELFYEGRLSPAPGLERVRLDHAGRFDGAGLWIVPCEHDGNRSASDEEAELVAALIAEIAEGRGSWMDLRGTRHPLRDTDILVVAPYNAHVNRVEARLRASGLATRVGTVDKFQGQEAAVVIYTMGTSSPEEAPRGLEFLYNASRLNVATSRARAAVILVASPRLFSPDCHTPRQMSLANALCRLHELTR